MNAPTKIEAPANLALWEALGKTDPKQTKQFSRAGGFKGTALKPIWIIKRLTEQFGPVGIGWGMGAPHFQVERAGDETLVYCTVRCWHTDEHNGFYGVGGDKVTTKRRDGGAFNDDEAFKKAFTDAVGNAFKFVGVGADIHMGQFDDSKYVQQVAAEFAEGHSQNGAVSPPQPSRGSKHSALRQAYKTFVHEANGCGDGDMWSAFMALPESIKVVNEIREKLPHIWDGSNWPTDQERPDLFEPLETFINRRAKECADATAAYLSA